MTEQTSEESQQAVDQPISRRRQAGVWGVMGEGGARAGKGAIMAPERHPLPNCKQAPLLTKTLLGSPGWLTPGWRVAARDQLPGRDTHSTPEKACPCCTPRKKNERLGCECDKTYCPPGSDCAYQAPGHLSYQTWKDTKRRPNRSPAFREYQIRTLSSLGPESAHNPGPHCDSSRKSN